MRHDACRVLAGALRSIAVVALVISLSTGFPLPLPQEAAAQEQAAPIDGIRIEGNQRIEEATVLTYMKIRPGDQPSAKDLDDALKALFATGLFADISIARDGNELVVTLVENPIINRIAFEGNLRVSDDILEQEVSLRPRVVFTRNRVQADMQRLLEIYRRSGRFTATVEPKVVQLPQNRVDLIFEISEGALTKVRKITFVGNDRFDDSDLREVIQTKEEAWYRFLSSDDTYDPDRIAYDQELLRRHYLKHGYAEFRILSADAELTPDKEAFFVTFTLSEGQRYKVGTVEVSSAFRGLDVTTLQSGVTLREGDWYDAEELETTIANVTAAATEAGFAFVEIAPDIRRNRESLSVDLKLSVNEGPRVFVERVEIQGNSRTLDEVIRREMLLVEGDAFNSSKLRRSRQRILNLGFFDTVEVKSETGSAPDKTVISVVVSERATGALSFGVGYSSTSGALGSISIQERNLLGRGQNLRLELQTGTEQQEIDLSFTEPYFLDRNLRAGVDVFRIQRDHQNESSYDHQSTGLGLRMGYQITRPLSQHWTYTLREDELTDVQETASAAIRELEGDFLTSSLGHRMIYDRRDSTITPTDGFVFEFENILAGIGGDRRYLKNRWKGSLYHEVAEDWVLGTRLGLGYLFSLEDDEKTHIVDRFFLGGDSLRGFQFKGIGPRDETTGDALGGNWYYSATVGVTFPLGLPNELGIKGRIFADAGSIGDIDHTAGADTDTGSLRASVGTGISWRTPLGPMNLDLSTAIAKEDFDKTESFRFSFGTRF